MNGNPAGKPNNDKKDGSAETKSKEFHFEQATPDFFCFPVPWCHPIKKSNLYIRKRSCHKRALTKVGRVQLQATIR
jgi:hypothetical protein